MVYTTETDIVSPSVTTKDPLGLLSQEIFIRYRCPVQLSQSHAVQNSNQL